MLGMRSVVPFLAPLVLVACGTDDASAPTRGGSTSSSSSSGGPPGVSDASTDASRGDAGSDAGPPAPLYGFVGTSGGTIRTYAVDEASGAWTFKAESNAGGSPSFLAFDPSRRRVVATDENAAGGLVRSFTFDPGSGSLTEVNSKATGGAGTTHVSLDPSGRWVFAANYTGGTMAVLPIDASGTLGAATDTRAPGAMTHWAGTDPAGTHAFAVSLGGNLVAQYGLDTTTGKLTDNGSASPPASSGPRHLAFHPTQGWAYLINETAITVTAFDYDKASGKLTAKQTLSALPGGQSSAGVSGAEIVVHPSGKWVYASTRIYDSIAHFSVNAADGKLTLVANAPTGGHRPRSFAMAPEGTLVFAGNQDVNQVVGFRVDATSGALTSIGKVADVTGPTFVGLARIP